MKLNIESGQIIHSRGTVPAHFPVLDAREIGDTIVVVYDYMSFPSDAPARNLFAYSSLTGQELWRSEDIGAGKTDAYTNIISESPLVVGNFASCDCGIDIKTGKVTKKVFSK